MKGFGLLFIGMGAGLIFFEWLAIVLLGRMFPIYRKRWVRVGYWLAVIGSIMLLLASRYVDAGVFPEAMLKMNFWAVVSPFVLLLLMPLVYGLLRSMRIKPSKPDASRRTLIKVVGAGLPALAYGTSGYGVFRLAGAIEVLRYAPRIRALPQELEGFRIAQLSDIHLGVFVSLDKLDELLELTAAEKPDMLVITGDFIDAVNWSEEAVARVDALARQLPYGAYFCWGNHEYLRDKSRIVRAFYASSIKVLTNRAVVVAKCSRPLWLLGVDYPWAKDLQTNEASRVRMVKEAMDGVPPDAVKVLLAHHSDFIAEGVANGIDLTLTGHTHGGQFAFGQTALLPVRYRYMRGFYDADGAMGMVDGGSPAKPTAVGDGQALGYVNAGAGSWFPMRFGCPPEITIFTLKRNEER